MENGSIVDLTAGTFLLLFTSADVGIDGSIFDLISKFGVVAVLWFWLRDMKIQMKEQLTTFSGETEKLRIEHEKNVKEVSEIHKDFRDRMEKQITVKDEQIKTLQDKLKD
jgi:hypothetical protein